MPFAFVKNTDCNIIMYIINLFMYLLTLHLHPLATYIHLHSAHGIMWGWWGRPTPLPFSSVLRVWQWPCVWEHCHYYSQRTQPFPWLWLAFVQNNIWLYHYTHLISFLYISGHADEARAHDSLESQMLQYLTREEQQSVLHTSAASDVEDLEQFARYLSCWNFIYDWVFWG